LTWIKEPNNERTNIAADWHRRSAEWHIVFGAPFMDPHRSAQARRIFLKQA
jgi:hypothetical protein